MPRDRYAASFETSTSAYLYACARSYAAMAGRTDTGTMSRTSTAAANQDIRLIHGGSGSVSGTPSSEAAKQTASSARNSQREEMVSKTKKFWTAYVSARSAASPARGPSPRFANRRAAPKNEPMSARYSAKPAM